MPTSCQALCWGFTDKQTHFVPWVRVLGMVLEKPLRFFFYHEYFKYRPSKDSYWTKPPPAFFTAPRADTSVPLINAIAVSTLGMEISPPDSFLLWIWWGNIGVLQFKNLPAYKSINRNGVETPKVNLFYFFFIFPIIQCFKSPEVMS